MIYLFGDWGLGIGGWGIGGWAKAPTPHPHPPTPNPPLYFNRIFNFYLFKENIKII